VTENKKKPLEFETAFEQLEEILEKMNTGTVSLDESLTLYEKADKLIVSCHERLQKAEKRIETLIKNREGKLELSPEKIPQTVPFNVEEND